MSETHTESRRISVVVPCFNEREVLPLLVERINEVKKVLHRDWGLEVEVIIVDDGSNDGSWEWIRDCVRRGIGIVGVRLSRNFGHQAAIWCGLGFVRGDAAISMDADLQDPPEVIPALVSDWRSGADVVLAVRQRREGEGIVKRWPAKMFYWLLMSLGADRVRVDCGDFRLLSKRCVTELLSLREHDPFLRGLVGWMGFRTSEVAYDRRPRACGKIKFTLSKLCKLASDGIVGCSNRPLRFAWGASAVVGLAMLGSVVFEMLSIGIHGKSVLQDSRWLLGSVMMIGMLNFLALGVIGEYVARTLDNVRHRPLFIVEEVVSFPLSTDQLRAAPIFCTGGNAEGGASGAGGI